MTKITVNLEKYKHTNKPTVDEIKIIQNVLYKSETQLTAEQFAFEISKNGKTSMLATFNRTDIKSERTSNINFKQQQVLMLDFDNSEKDVEKYGLTTFDSIKNDKFIQQNASFMYKTFSDKDSDVDKFRVVIVLNKKVKDYLDVQNAYDKLLKMFPSADTKCRNTNRLFFGSNSGYEEINFKNTLNVDDFLSDILKVKNDLDKYKVTETQFKQYRIKKVTQNDKVYELIKQNTVESLSKARDIVLSKYDEEIQRIYNSKAQARVNFRHTLDIREFLDLPNENPFQDILAEDNTPSASIVETNGIQLYHLFNKSSNNNYDIIRLIAKLIEDTCKEQDIYGKALDILLFLTNSQIDKDSKIANIVDNIQLLRNILISETLKDEYPNLNKILGSDTLALTVILDLMSEYSYEDFKTGEVRQLLFMNSENLSRTINHRLNTNYTKDRVQRVLNKATLIQFVDKLDDASVPKVILDKYTSNQIAKKHMKINFYEVSDTNIENKEEKSAKLVENHFTLKSLNFEGIHRILGIEEAKRLFNNREEYAKHKKLNVNDELMLESKLEIENKIAKYVLSKVQNKGYVSEKEVEIYTKKYILKNKTNAERTMKQVRANICNTYSLELVKVNKETRATYSIADSIKSNSKVFVVV